MDEPIEPVELGDLVVDELLPGEELEPELPLLMPDEELPLELGEVPPAAPDSCFLKNESHSERDTCPSWLVSASEKLGVEALVDPLADELGELLEDELGDDELPEDELGDELELEPLADGVDEDDDGKEDDGLLLDDDEDCATAAEDSANSTAAVRILSVLGMEPPVMAWVETASRSVQALCP